MPEKSLIEAVLEAAFIQNIASAISLGDKKQEMINIRVFTVLAKYGIDKKDWFNFMIDLVEATEGGRRQMSVNSKEKGKRYEREIANWLKEQGFDARRTAQYCGNTGDASDVVGLPGVHIECKHVEKANLHAWVEQAIRDSGGTGNIPVIFWKQNRMPQLAIMLRDDWLKMYMGETDGSDS